MVRLVLSILIALLLASCSGGPTRTVEVPYNIECQHNGTVAAAQACAEVIRLVQRATLHGARGFDLYCNTGNGTAREINICYGVLKERFENAGINFGNPGSSRPVYPRDHGYTRIEPAWDSTGTSYGRGYGYGGSGYQWNRPLPRWGRRAPSRPVHYPPNYSRPRIDCGNHVSGSPWDCMPNLQPWPHE